MSEPGRPGLDELLSRLDRRIVYIGLLLICLLPLVAGWNLPLYLSQPPKSLYATIEALPPDKVVVISSDWDAGTQAENRPQLVALTRHLIRRNLRFIVFSIGYPNSPQLAQDAILRAIELENAADRYPYGDTWVNLGFKLPDEAWLRGVANDLSQAIPADWQGRPIAGIPVMKGVKKWGPAGQISMLIDVASANTIERWYQFLGPTRVRIGLACTAVMAPEQYPFLDSGQLSGLLTGMRGAAEYELLIRAPDLGMRSMSGQSFAHAYIFILVLLGNLPQVMRLWRGRKRA